MSPATPSSKPNVTKAAKRAAAAARARARARAWAECHAADRWRTTLALVRSVGANVDRERQAIDPAITRTVYIGAALMAMESLPSALRRAFIRRYAELHGAKVPSEAST
ncbi:TPA: hypothetical protein QDB40_006131 [Burkholderia vietnamiensis]|nr:hypothetical protein [Burkholderia vietnamiensis]